MIEEAKKAIKRISWKADPYVYYTDEQFGDDVETIENTLREFEKTEKRIASLEEYNSLCSKIKTQHIFRGMKGGSRIKELDYTRENFAYEPEDNEIVVFNSELVDRLGIDDYGKWWAFTREELK